MAANFVIGMAALGGALLVLQRERVDMSNAQTARADPKKVIAGGVTIAQAAEPPPVDAGACGMPSMTASSDDGTTGGDTSCSPSTPTANLSGIGAVPTLTMAPAEEAAADTFVPPSTKASDSTVRGTAAGETPPTIPQMPSTTYRDYLLGVTYGVGQAVTRREESDNLQTVGPSMGAIW